LDSWLDAFIMGDVYVLGFGFDFLEFFLWGLQNNGRNCIHLFRKLYFAAAEGIPAE